LSITAGFTNATGLTPTYTWYQTDQSTATGGSPVGSDSATLTIPDSLTASSTNNKFYCVVSHAAANSQNIASVTSNLVTVTVYPSTTTLLNGVTIDNMSPAIGNTLTATATATTGTPTASYVWYTVDSNSGEGTNPVQIGTGATLSVTSAYFDKYIKVVATGTGSFAGTKYAITSNKVPSSGSTYSVDTSWGGSPETGSSYSPTINTTPAEAKPSLSYKWYRSESDSSTNPSEIDGAVSASYTPTSSDVGYYLYLRIKSNGAYTRANEDTPIRVSSKVIASTSSTIRNYLTDANTPLYNNVSSIWLYPAGGSAYYAALYTASLNGSSNDYKLLEQAAGGLAPLCAYDISLYNPGTMYGPYSLFFHLGPQYANQTFTVLHKLPTGAIEKTSVVSTASTGDIVVRTSSLSPFMVVMGSTPGTSTGTVFVPTTDVPKTGSGETSGIIGLMVAVAALVAAAFLGRAIIRRRQNQE
ncbi:MAG: hypothetical protein PHO41_10085, partial [Eubacteriales bacterium]|nr:hypothetical protein [Eubacteriales bacterium]